MTNTPFLETKQNKKNNNKKNNKKKKSKQTNYNTLCKCTYLNPAWDKHTLKPEMNSLSGDVIVLIV